MVRVWKFTLPMPDASGRAIVELPKEGVPVSVAIQDSMLVVWVQVDDAKMAERREPYTFVIVNTGMEFTLPEGARFLGTALHPIGVVWHVWAER